MSTVNKSQGQRPDQGNTRKEDVYVVVEANGGFTGESFEFQLRPADGKPGGSYLKDGVLDFRNAGNAKFDLHFLLHDPSGTLRFPDRVEDAIWIKEGGPCPTGPSSDKQEFPKGSVSDDGEELTVENRNKKKRRFEYALRFNRNDGKPAETFDPVIENGGGNLSAF